MIDAALNAIAIVADPFRLGILLSGVLLGLLIGVIPGLSGVAGLAILIPFTYTLDQYSAFALLIGMAAVTSVSDVIPAILFGVPGTVGAAATVIDGHALARSGQAGRALGAGYSAALIGALFGALVLAVAIPVVRPLVLYLGTPELLAFCIFGLSMVAILSGKAPLKGLAAACIGLLIAMVGTGSQLGTSRWTFDTLYLWEEVPLVPLTLGLFALPEIADLAIARTAIAKEGGGASFSSRAQWEGVRDVFRNWWLVLRSSTIGVALGAVPGLGASSIDWIVYGHAVATERNGRFGQGDIRGVMAPESANSAKDGGQLIPTIAFGVPGGAATAVLLSAFLMHGLVPGPDMLTKNLDVTYSIMWSLALANVAGLLICLPLSGFVARLSAVPAGRIVPIVVGVVIIAAVQATQDWGDLYSLMLFGIVGWVMKANGWPRPPLMLGFVLGALFERYLFISITLYGGEWIFRPVVIAILALTAIAIFRPLRAILWGTYRSLRRAHLEAFTPHHGMIFNLLVIALTVYAIRTSSPWPWEDKLLPQVAAYAGLVFAGLNLFTEAFSRREDDEGGLDIDGAGAVAAIPGAIVWTRAARFFGWVVGTILAALAIGVLPAAFLGVLFQSRFEFRQTWRFSLVSSLSLAAIAWLIVNYIFMVRWPQASLGDWLPALRASIHLF
ncbi:tripartite tricarboxylate transporter permease [Propylenella binzhouense]|uniref:DUF112 domain-containing protein n=1 Tax=Propylenella binzhouense TaxID=2555902 RepID=A0A964WTY1_9HYPH|nr:tripartite tricarboxylate transporter permease [Propylenella binzhouense]MYZ48517.1 hypothetical protein [Propylenella binzhouense]